MSLSQPFSAPTDLPIEHDNRSPTTLSTSTSSSLSINLSSTINPSTPSTTNTPTKNTPTRSHREFSLAFKVNLLHELEQNGLSLDQLRNTTDRHNVDRVNKAMQPILFSKFVTNYGINGQISVWQMRKLREKVRHCFKPKTWEATKVNHVGIGTKSNPIRNGGGGRRCRVDMDTQLRMYKDINMAKYSLSATLATLN